jgi:hypothetical protein
MKRTRNNSGRVTPTKDCRFSSLKIVPLARVAFFILNHFPAGRSTKAGLHLDFPGGDTKTGKGCLYGKLTELVPGKLKQA